MKWLEAKRILWANILKVSKGAEIDRLEFLRTMPFFEHLSWWQLGQVCGILHERQFEKGEFLFEQGSPGAALFMVAAGQVSIEMVEDGNTPVELANLGKGAFLGELALLDQSPRSASARALGPVTAFALFREDLNRLVQSEPEIAVQIFRSLAVIVGDRLKATNHLVENERKSAA